MRVAALVAIGAGLCTAAAAQTAKAPPVSQAAPASQAPPASQPPPASQDWSQTVTKELGPGEFDAKQLEIVQKLTAYFNEMGDMKGEFQQISPDGKRLRGYIYVKRPNSFRFEYRRPSRQLIISDGKSMIIQDLDLKTDDRWGLDKTPFRIILKKDVDLQRDARILEVSDSEDRIQLTLQDKDPTAVGRLKLLFQKSPAIELKEWITADSQGLETKVELSDFAKAENLDEKLFVPQPIWLHKPQQ
jgi:outer membrane lipoprotein-sorting protein